MKVGQNCIDCITFLISAQFPNLKNVSSTAGTKFFSDAGNTAGDLQDFSILSTAATVTSRFHLPYDTLKLASFLVTVC